MGPSGLDGQNGAMQTSGSTEGSTSVDTLGVMIGEVAARTGWEADLTPRRGQCGGRFSLVVAAVAQLVGTRPLEYMNQTIERVWGGVMGSASAQRPFAPLFTTAARLPARSSS